MSSRKIYNKLKWSLPWLARYPIVRLNNFLQSKTDKPKSLIFTIANHFEPAWSDNGLLDLDAQKRALDDYYKLARKTGEAIRDTDGTKFCHTNFYPAEQYDRDILEKMAEMQAESLGEVEIHLHHGIEKPDTAENTRRILTEFRDILAEEHKCLSRFDGKGKPKYAFVHGNLALANSADGKFCGVDEEMQILQETGCYVDMTMPSAPDITQVPMINQIYECGLPLTEKIPHRKGKAISVGSKITKLPLIFTGPLVLNWTRRINGLPFPRLDEGSLSESQPRDLARLNRWISADIIVQGCPEWIFIKLYCHGFFTYDQSACIGEKARKFFSEIIESGEKTGDYKVYFASAREAFNMVSAAVDGKKGNPGKYRNYRLQAIMNKTSKQVENKEPVNIIS